MAGDSAFLPTSTPIIAEPTQPSPLMDFINNLNRVGYASTNAEGALLNGENLGKVAKAYKAGLSLKEQHSGADLVHLLRTQVQNGISHLTKSFADKIAPLVLKDPEELKKWQDYSANNPPIAPIDFEDENKGLGFNPFMVQDLELGLVHDMFDPTNPANYLQLGELSKAGKVLKAITRAGEEGLNSEKLAKGIGEQMSKGQRSLASVFGLHTPDVINKPVGRAISLVGQALDNPLTRSISNAFSPAYTALRTSMGVINNKTERLINSLGLGPDLEKVYNPTLQNAIKELKANPDQVMGLMKSYYMDELGLNPQNTQDAKTIVEKELQRHGEFPILKNQKVEGGTIDDLKDIINPNRVQIRLQKAIQDGKKINSAFTISQMKAYIAKQQLGIEKTKIRPLALKGTSIDFSPLENVWKQETKTLNNLSKQKALNKKNIQELTEKFKDLSKPNANRLATASHNLMVVTDPRFENEAHSSIQALTNIVKGKYGQIGEMATKNGLSMPLIHLEDYMGRKISPEAQKALAGQSKGNSQLFGSGDTSPRALKDFTTEQSERMFANPLTRKTMFENNFGNEPLVKKELLKNPKNGSLYETDPLKILEHKANSASKAVAGLHEFKNLLNNGIFSKSREAFKNASPLDVPEAYQKSLNLKQAFVPENVRQEFYKNRNLFNEGDSGARAFAKFTSRWKKEVVARTPFMGIPMSMKYLYGHGRIADMNHALTPQGVEYASRAIKPFFQRQGLFEKGAQGIKDFDKAIDKIPGIPIDRVNIDPKAPQWKPYIKSDGTFNLAKLFENRGGASEGQQMTLEADPTGNMVSPKKIGRIIDKVTGTNLSLGAMRSADSFSRLQYAASKILKDHYAPDVALDEARNKLYDYSGGLSPFEQKWARNLVPFYSWMRLNTPQMAKNILINPSSGNKMLQAKNNFEDTLGRHPAFDTRFVPEYIQGQPNIRISPNSIVSLANMDPMADLQGFLSPMDAIKTGLGALNPVIKEMMEQGLNVSGYKKDDLDQPEPLEQIKGEKDRFLGMDLPKQSISAISELYPAAARLNTINPFHVFGKEGQPDSNGYVRTQPEMSTKDKLLNFLSMKAQPVNYFKSIMNARSTFDQESHKYQQVIKQDAISGNKGKLRDDLNNFQKFLKTGVFLGNDPRQDVF